MHCLPEAKAHWFLEADHSWECCTGNISKCVTGLSVVFFFFMVRIVIVHDLKFLARLAITFSDHICTRLVCLSQFNSHYLKRIVHLEIKIVIYLAVWLSSVEHWYISENLSTQHFFIYILKIYTNKRTSFFSFWSFLLKFNWLPVFPIFFRVSHRGFEVHELNFF